MELVPATPLRRLAFALGLALGVMGALSFAGWLLVEGMVAALAMALSLAPLEAAALLLCGVAVALRASEEAPRASAWVSRACAAAATSFAAVALVGELMGLDLLARTFPALRVAPSTSPLTAAALLLLGLAALTLDARPWSAFRPAQVLALLASLVPLQEAVSFLYGIPPSADLFLAPHITMAGCVGLAGLAAAVVLARPEHGVVELLASPGPAGFTSRRLLGAIALLPLVLGWLFVLVGLRSGHQEALAGSTLVVVAAVAAGAVVVWWNARAIQRVDEDRTGVEETLRAQREWFRTTLASIGDAVIAADERGRVVDLNAVAQALTGCRTEAALGRPLGEVFKIHGANWRELESPFDRVLRERRVVTLPREAVLTGRGGDELAVEGSAAPIRDRRGRPRGVVLVFRDMRERRRVEEERASLLERERAARAEAEATSRAKDEFIAMLSHELRTPLNAVLGWARLLRSGKLDPGSAQRAIDAIERGAHTQAQIVDDLLDTARIVRGQLRLNVLPIELSPVVEAAAEIVRPAAAAREISLVTKLDANAGLVPADPARLQQVVWNLLANAVKFTPAGGRIEVRLESRGEQVVLTVADTGSGIAPTFLPHVFERFRQADSSATRAHGGLGLGLAIVRHLVEAHGGTVEADSPGPGLGSTFTVSLPLVRAPAVKEAGAVTDVPT